MSDQKPTEKGGADQIPTMLPKCPQCGENVPGLNVSTMILPTPQDPNGNMTFLMPCCPHCCSVLGVQFIGYQPNQAGVATPPSTLWKPH